MSSFVPKGELPAPEDKKTEAGENSYRQILKSSALIGGSSLFNIGLGIVRVKTMAVLLGPAGVGLMGLYSSIADLAQCIAGMGVNNSGVRQIAEAVGSCESVRVARTVIVLRRIAVLLGLLGAGILFGLSKQVSTLTFGDGQRSGMVGLLAVAVFFTSIAGGQTALVQGMRRISDLAQISVVGGFCGLLLSIPFLFFLREAGVVPALIGMAAMTMTASWWYGRRIPIDPIVVEFGPMREEAASLLKLGFVFMASGVLAMSAAYIIRIMVVRQSGIEAGGLYQSAWGLGGLYIGFILQAMGADFYPRLTAIAKDDLECNRLVNEQAHISLLLAGPGVIGTLTLAPLVIALFYSPRFAAAVDILRWICLGMTLRVVSWPMGFILPARGSQQIFFWTEVAATLLHLGLARFCITRFGAPGAGVAFFLLYVFHAFLIYAIVRQLTGFRWTRSNQMLGKIYLALIGLAFADFYLLPFWPATCLGTMIASGSAIYSLRALLNLVSPSAIPPRVRQILAWLRLTRAE